MSAIKKAKWFLKRHNLSASISNIQQLVDLVGSGSGGNATWTAHVIPNGGGVDGVVYTDEGATVLNIDSSVKSPSGTVNIDRSGYEGTIDVAITGTNGMQDIDINLASTESIAAWYVVDVGYAGVITVVFTDENTNTVTYNLTYVDGV